MFEKPQWALRAESIPVRRGYPPREEWGPGPWQDEPDLVEWRNDTGYALLIVRGGMGALCGYVGVPPGHPLHGVRYNTEDHEALDSLHVHGGLTFSDACHEGGHICHVAQPGEPDQVWWLGFDCNHGGDYDPGGRAICRKYIAGGRPMEEHEQYWALEAVRGEVESLAAQLKSLESAPSEGAAPAGPGPQP